MAIPDRESLFLPFLKITADGKEHSTEDMRQMLADQFGLTNEDRIERAGNSTSSRFTNDVAFARVRLGMAGLLDTPEGSFKISAKGLECLRENPIQLSYDDLRAWKERLGLIPDRITTNNNTTVEPLISENFRPLCEATHLPPDFFADFEMLLKTKKQIILEGVPGTGKTFVAEKVAEWFAGPHRSHKQVKLVQFHESYGYEDFVYGIKPAYDDSTRSAGFRNRPGVFLNFCQEARNEKDKHFILIIDEINRGKPSRVFGELLYLLEYREKVAELQSGLTFGIPENVYIIGTMNTVDKSIALVDYALRRRFSFLTLNAVKDGKSVVLRKWLEKKQIRNAEEIERIFIALNNLIAAKDEALTIGHSYFMPKDAEDGGEFTLDMLNFIWKYNIIPLAREYEYELKAGEVENKYRLESIRRQAGLF